MYFVAMFVCYIIFRHLENFHLIKCMPLLVQITLFSPFYLIWLESKAIYTSYTEIRAVLTKKVQFRSM